MSDTELPIDLRHTETPKERYEAAAKLYGKALKKRLFRMVLKEPSAIPGIEGRFWDFHTEDDKSPFIFAVRGMAAPRSVPPPSA